MGQPKPFAPASCHAAAAGRAILCLVPGGSGHTPAEPHELRSEHCGLSPCSKYPLEVRGAKRPRRPRRRAPARRQDKRTSRASAPFESRPNPPEPGPSRPRLVAPIPLPLVPKGRGERDAAGKEIPNVRDQVSEIKHVAVIVHRGHLTRPPPGPALPAPPPPPPAPLPGAPRPSRPRPGTSAPSAGSPGTASDAGPGSASRAG